MSEFIEKNFMRHKKIAKSRLSPLRVGDLVEVIKSHENVLEDRSLHKRYIISDIREDNYTCRGFIYTWVDSSFWWKRESLKLIRRGNR